jgi:hypothetical protein
MVKKTDLDAGETEIINEEDVSDEKTGLNILDEARRELNEEQRNKLSLILKWDLSFLFGEPLYRQGLDSERFHKPAIEELRKFLAIKIVFEPKQMGMFGPMVVAAWHAFILHTKEYEKFCGVHYGKMIHHVPGHKSGDDTSVWLGVYHYLFGDLPEVWKLELDGLEIPKMETNMNVERCCDADHLDSDDGAY